MYNFAIIEICHCKISNEIEKVLLNFIWYSKSFTLDYLSSLMYGPFSFRRARHEVSDWNNQKKSFILEDNWSVLKKFYESIKLAKEFHKSCWR